MKRLATCLALLATGLSAAFAETSATRELALDLFAEGDTTPAALEFRRLAFETEDPAEQAGWNWMAAYAYSTGDEEDRIGLTTRSLDRAEATASGDDLAAALTWLRAETASDGRHWEEAAFYYRSLERKASTNDTLRDYALREQAVVRLRAGDPEGAREPLERLPDPIGRKAALEALDGYATAKRKNPVLGGFLGIIPGLGYLYSGEYGNAARSFFLNGIFIWGMVETASEDQWGLFSVLAFGELTWYSGSIYGGIDSAHRYNRERLDEALDAIAPAAEPSPELATLPLVHLRFTF